MGTNQAAGHAESVPVEGAHHPQPEGEPDSRGVIFRLGARMGLLVFGAVLVVAIWNGMDPALALVRSLIALSGIVVLAWFGERAVAPRSTVDVIHTASIVEVSDTVESTASPVDVDDDMAND